VKVEVNSAALADAVAWTSQVIPARPARPILSGVKIEAADGLLKFSAFDYERTARYSIEASSAETGTMVVQGKLLSDIAKNLPAENTTLATDDNRVRIVSGGASFNLPLMAADEYPDLPAVPETVGKVKGSDFNEAVNQAIVAVARDENRPVLTGVHLRFGDGTITMTATDRFRLSRASLAWQPTTDGITGEALVRGSILKDVSRSVDPAQDVVLGLEKDGRMMGFQNAGHVSTASLIDGEFPTVDRLFADEYPVHAVIDRMELVNSLRRVSLVAERNAPITLEFSQNKVRLSAGAADESQASEVIDADLDGSPITVAFNPGYLLEGLQAITEPFVHIKMTTAIKPVEFNGQHSKGDEPSLDYRYLLVPMRMAG
jgi:DNA polymerase-3 subunit beta